MTRKGDRQKKSPKFRPARTAKNYEEVIVRNLMVFFAGVLTLKKLMPVGTNSWNFENENFF